MFYPIILGIHGYGMCIALLMLVASELLLVALDVATPHQPAWRFMQVAVQEP